jgi:hypothetical protein
MKRCIITEYSEEDLKNLIANVVKDTIQQSFSQFIPTLSNSPPNNSTDRFFSRKELCAKMKISLPTLANIQKRGEIKATIVAGSYRYTQKSLDDYLKKSTQK